MGTTPIIKSNSPDAVYNTASNVCLVLLDGADSATSAASGFVAILGGNGPDNLNVAGPGLVAGGADADAIEGSNVDERSTVGQGAMYSTAIQATITSFLDPVPTVLTVATATIQSSSTQRVKSPQARSWLETVARQTS